MNDTILRREIQSRLGLKSDHATYKLEKAGILKRVVTPVGEAASHYDRAQAEAWIEGWKRAGRPKLVKDGGCWHLPEEWPAEEKPLEPSQIVIDATTVAMATTASFRARIDDVCETVSWLNYRDHEIRKERVKINEWFESFKEWTEYTKNEISRLSGAVELLSTRLADADRAVIYLKGQCTKLDRDLKIERERITAVDVARCNVDQNHYARLTYLETELGVSEAKAPAMGTSIVHSIPGVV